MLRLHAETAALGIRDAANAFERAVQTDAGVKLDTRLGRINFQHAPIAWQVSARGQAWFRRDAAAQNKIVIVSSEAGLLHALADFVRRREIERRSFDRRDFSGGDQLRIDRRVL